LCLGMISVVAMAGTGICRDCDWSGNCINTDEGFYLCNSSDPAGGWCILSMPCSSGGPGYF
jgi:hypothetical protein